MTEDNFPVKFVGKLWLEKPLSVSKTLDKDAFGEILLVFGQQFDVLKDKYGLSETLKIHVIK